MKPPMSKALTSGTTERFVKLLYVEHILVLKTGLQIATTKVETIP